MGDDRQCLQSPVPSSPNLRSCCQRSQAKVAKQMLPDGIVQSFQETTRQTNCSKGTLPSRSSRTKMPERLKNPSGMKTPSARCKIERSQSRVLGQRIQSEISKKKNPEHRIPSARAVAKVHKRSSSIEVHRRNIKSKRFQTTDIKRQFSSESCQTKVSK